MAIIKQHEEDFIVKEIYKDFKIKKDRSEYSYYIMMKKGLTTYDAISKIASKLNLDIKDIGYAGNKDKKAITFQMISLPTFFLKQDPSEIFNDETLALEFYGYSDQPIKLGDLKGNVFEITARECKVKLPKNIEKFYFANYFDDQRFSINNVKIGEAIIKNDFKSAIIYILEYSFPDAKDKFGFWMDFEIIKADKVSKIILEHLLKQPKDLVGAIRKIPINVSLMYIHAYQSFLFNEILNKFTELYFEKKYPIKIMNRTYYTSDELIKYLDDVKIPLVGFATEISKYALYDISTLLLELMAQQEITFRDFVVHAYPLLSTPGNERKAYEKADITIESKGKSTYLLKFELPPGSYATTIVKSLFAKFDEEVIVED
ncbi:MAG: tRNA pseudouridine(13) synthase TruD [Candidatus Woesearchaeota archaeon]